MTAIQAPGVYENHSAKLPLFMTTFHTLSIYANRLARPVLFMATIQAAS